MRNFIFFNDSSMKFFSKSWWWRDVFNFGIRKLFYGSCNGLEYLIKIYSTKNTTNKQQSLALLNWIFTLRSKTMRFNDVDGRLACNKRVLHMNEHKFMTSRVRMWQIEYSVYLLHIKSLLRNLVTCVWISWVNSAIIQKLVFLIQYVIYVTTRSALLGLSTFFHLSNW